MPIGGGAFDAWQRVGSAPSDDPAFRATAIDVLRIAGNAGLSQRKLLEAIRKSGVSFSNEVARRWLLKYAADATVPIDMHPPDKPGSALMFYSIGGSR